MRWLIVLTEIWNQVIFGSKSWSPFCCLIFRVSLCPKDAWCKQHPGSAFRGSLCVVLAVVYVTEL